MCRGGLIACCGPGDGIRKELHALSKDTNTRDEKCVVGMVSRRDIRPLLLIVACTCQAKGGGFVETVNTAVFSFSSTVPPCARDFWRAQVRCNTCDA